MKFLLKIIFFCSCINHSLVGQILTTKQTKFIADNFISLQVDENYQNANWSPVLKSVQNKRLVLLGEFNHGSKEVFSTRNELIQVLHKKLGFDLILFESGLGEMEVLNLKKSELEPVELTTSFFGVWKTMEFEDLMTYIKSQNIPVSGFDVQRSGQMFTNYLSERVNNKETFLEAEKKFGSLISQLSNYRTVYDSVSAPTLQLIDVYEGIEAKLNKQDEFSERTLSNRIRFLTYMLDFSKTKDWSKRWRERDLAMADNIKWILNRYPNKKAIIIAHNYHIARYNEKEAVMGEFLKEEFEDEMYVVGVFAGQGSFADNAGQMRQLSPPDESGLDIKHIIAADQSRMTFLNAPKNVPAGAEWLQEPIIANDTFIDLSNSNKLILSKCFDGLLLLDTITPPQKQLDNK
jgi:erythromycin esterase